HALGQDIFAYFGLGCRNVSKIYVPRGYNFEPLLEALHEFRDIVLHEKYKHNFDYNYALFVLNRAEFLNTGSLILQENPSLLSRIACLHYEYYDSQEDLAASLHVHREDIQCLVAGQPLDSWNTLAFGTTQQPGLHDYPDGVDVMQFLRTMSLP
ncbi:MAG: acyl-CoA reductase, partial [Saprospiraceae bacterium]|nr:acyl-CoA reductase [Saprospiraceae bacterium]